MKVNLDFDEEQVRILLVGSREEQDEGLRLINQHLCKGVSGWLRKLFPGIQPNDLAVIWGEILSNIWTAVQGDKFDGDAPLMPWLCTIARARAIDFMRRQEVHDRFIEGMRTALADTETGKEWEGLDPLERREIMEAIRLAIAPLPLRQRVVMEVFVDHFPETTKMPVLQELVSELTGKPETLASIKRALQEARVKVRSFLQSKGYGIGKRGKV